MWDADGREFIDYRNSLGPITLGYQFPATDEAIRRQLESGIIFGHPHPLECEVAEARAARLSPPTSAWHATTRAATMWCRSATMAG